MYNVYVIDAVVYAIENWKIIFVENLQPTGYNYVGV